MYTNRGFLHRNYGQKSIRQPTYELRLPKISHFSPQNNYSPNMHSTNTSKQYKYVDSYSPSPNKHYTNIFSNDKSSRNLSIETTKSYNAMPTYDTSRSPKPRFEDKPLNTTNPLLAYSIFEIFGAGYSYNTKSGYGSPLGMGFLITKSLAITANSVIPDEDLACRCFARFADNLYETHSFDASSFFYTNRDLNFTVIGFCVNPDSKRQRAPLEFREDFVLRDGDYLTYLNSASQGRNVTAVDREMFSYTAGSFVSPGMPLFTLDWKLQGIHHTCTASYKFNQATRIDAIIRCILTVRTIATHPELDLLLTDFSSNTKREEIEVGESRYIYWVEWYNRNIYRYDIPLERWTKLKIANISEFLQSEQGEWNFNWGSRMVYINNRIFIIGGVGHELSSTKADCYEFRTDTREIFRKRDMQERREGPAAVITKKGFVYVIGGKYSYSSCEKYSIKDDAWFSLAPMNYGRYEPVAVLLNNEKSIYVIGGFPQEMVGKSIEKYDIDNDSWEISSISFPYPVVHPGIFPVSQKKFALLGGRFCRAVTIVEIVEELSGQRLDNNVIERIKFYEIDSLPEQLETVYPVIFYKEDNKIYLMKSQEGSSPQVFFYNVKNFLKPRELTQDPRRTLKLPPLQAKANELNSSFD